MSATKPSTIFREESRPSRFLTWPIIFLGAVVVFANGKNATVLSALYVFAGALLTVLLLEFMAVTLEVTEKEVRFSAPFYRRKIPIAGIRHWEVKTYPSANWRGVRRVYMWQPPKHSIGLTMINGAVFTITSDHPERLAHAIIKAKEMSWATQII